MDKDYLLGVAPDEINRLGFQHEVFDQDTQALLKKAGIRRDLSVIDLGCGPGFVSLELARLVGQKGHVLAIDQSKECVNTVNALCKAQGLSNVTTSQQHLEELATDSKFDLAFARWVFCYLKSPKDLLARTLDALKPNGKLVVIDYLGIDHLIAPHFPEYEPILKAVNIAFNETSGGNLAVMKKLPQYVSELGATLEQVTPIQHIGRPRDLLWDWVETFYQSFIPTLHQRGDLNTKYIEPFWQAWNAAKSNPNTYLFAMPMLGMVIRK